MKFPVHHKARHEAKAKSPNKVNASFVPIDPIERIITRASCTAEDIMNVLKLPELFKENGLRDIQSLNTFAFRQRSVKSAVDYSYFSEDYLYHSSVRNDTGT